MRKNIQYFFLFWLSAIVLMYVSFLSILSPLHALRNTLGFILPIILPVFLLDRFFENYFLKRRFLLFSVYAILIITGFGVFNFYLFRLVIQNKEAETNTILTMITFFLIYRGIRFFKQGVQQQFQLHQAKAAHAQTEVLLKETESHKVRAELDLLKSQINPHFLFNTLNNIFSLITEGAEQAGDSVLKLSSLMRYVLESSRNEFVLLSEEVTFIQDFIDLEKIRLEDNCRIEFNYENTYQDRKIAPLLFVPLVENCFKHGISANKQKNVVVIKMKNDTEGVFFSAVNHIAPARMNPTIKSSGHGIENLRKRLHFIYPLNHSYRVETKDNMYRVELILKI